MDRNFRAALNGFNRNDVVNYIEESAINHEKALRQLRDENTRLRADLERLQAEKDALESQYLAATSATEEEDQAICECADAVEAEIEPDAASAVTELELAAYRRAEAAERNAQNRAAKLCSQVNEIVETAAKQFEESDADVQALMSDLNICLRRLNDTFAELRLTFDNTSNAFSQLEALEVEEVL